MPTLEQKEDGDYYIRSYARSKGSVITWQVRGSGITYLNRHGVYPGNTFPVTLLHDMIAANHVFTNGSGIRPETTHRQNQSTIKNPPLKSIPPLKSSLPQASSPQKGKDNVRPTTIIRKSISLVFRKYKKRWELQIAFPKLLINQAKVPFTNSCRVTVGGATHTLKAKQLLRGDSEAVLTVMPQTDNYRIKLNVTEPSSKNIWSLLKESNITREVKGLHPSGTVFKKHKEAKSLKESVRLDEHEQMLLGHSYFLVFHSTCEPKLVPGTLIVHKLGSIGMWDAWEIHLPLKRDIVLESWCASLGHVLHK